VEIAGVAATEPYCTEVRRILLYALSRFGTRVQRVTVRLSDVGNPLGGVETLCRMDAQLRPWGVVRVQVLDGGNAINRAAARLGEHVAQRLLDGSDDEIPTRVVEPTIQFASPAAARGRTRRKVAAPKKRRKVRS